MEEGGRRGNANCNTPLSAGKGEEQRAAASLACLLCIQLGSGIESEEVFKTLKPIFKTILADGSANIQARQAVSVCVDAEGQRPGVVLAEQICPPSQVATSLGLCTLVAEDDILVSCSSSFFFFALEGKWASCFQLLSPSVPLQDVQATMECFESLFTRSYARADGSCPATPPQTSQLHTNALLSWALLLTICAASQLKDVLRM